MTKRGGCFLGNADVYVNIVGGLNINDPAIDLAVCAAIKSSYNDTVVEREKVFFGEVGLTGEVRGTWGVDAVISEAERVGYKELVVGEIKSKGSKKLSIKKVSKVNTL
jgi:DNA repair protein RadA/Sms